MSGVASVLAFTGAAAVLTVIPGLDMMLVLRTAAVEDARRAAAAALGIAAGCLAWGGLVAVGLGALIATSALAYDLLRLIGAAYLIYLGARMLLVKGEAVADHPQEGLLGGSWFLRGSLTNLLNPKVGVFYVAFLPPFVPPGVDPLPFTFMLACIHGGLGLAWFAIIIAGARSVAGRLAHPAVKVVLERITGRVLVALGVKVAIFSR